jgi:hypothetical protein
METAPPSKMLESYHITTQSQPRRPWPKRYFYFYTCHSYIYEVTSYVTTCVLKPFFYFRYMATLQWQKVKSLERYYQHIDMNLKETEVKSINMCKWLVNFHLLAHKINWLQVGGQPYFSTPYDCDSLTCQKWRRILLCFRVQAKPNQELVQIYYSALNFRNVMTATGRLVTNSKEDRLNQVRTKILCTHIQWQYCLKTRSVSFPTCSQTVNNIFNSSCECELLLGNSTDQSPSWEAYSHKTSEGIPCLSLNSEVYYYVNRSLLLDLILSQLNPKNVNNTDK